MGLPVPFLAARLYDNRPEPLPDQLLALFLSGPWHLDGQYVHSSYIPKSFPWGRASQASGHDFFVAGRRCRHEVT